MRLFIKVYLFKSPYVTFYLTEELFILLKNDTKLFNTIKVADSNSYTEKNDYDKTLKKKCKFKSTAFFLHPFVKECVLSETYRTNVLKNLACVTDCPEDGYVFLKLILEPPDKEIIDYSWNEKMLQLIWTRVDIENAFSWLSTLGGAYSALGDYFEHCAQEAGKISVRQYKLSKMLGDESLAARSRLYSSLAYAQQGKLKLARHIVREVAAFARLTHDRRLNRMCQGVWAKLKYLRNIKSEKRSIAEYGDCIVRSK